jgi:hypothetical protein
LGRLKTVNGREDLGEGGGTKKAAKITYVVERRRGNKNRAFIVDVVFLED